MNALETIRPYRGHVNLLSSSGFGQIQRERFRFFYLAQVVGG